jgi:Response regulator receiver domain
MHDPPRVLIVDDNETNRDILATRLATQGYDLCQAADGEEALVAARTLSPDLILLDVMMPKRVISGSPTDVQPVFDSIVASAVRLCGGRMGAVFEFDGKLVKLVAHHNYTPEALDALKSDASKTAAA